MPVPLDLDLQHHHDAQIVIDARMDEWAWEEAPVIDEWVVYWPAPDGVPEVHARARMTTDEEGIYVFYEVIDPEPDKVRARITLRDNMWGDDMVGIYLDPAGTAQRGYLFFVNPAGVQTDATRLANQDDVFAWDGQWESAGRLTEQGYDVEFKIPWSTVRHPADMDQIGVSLLRSVGRSGERSGWPRRDPDVSGILVQEYLVGGPGELGRDAGLQLIPSLTWGRTESGADDTRWNVGGVAPGVTVRYDPVPALALLATVNPDFSQVEADPNQVSVNQRYALRWSERRPFFQEGREWFHHNYGRLVYSRSMVQPRYGARATVEAGGWQLAALHVLDAAPQVSVSEGDSWDDEEILRADGTSRSAFDTVVRARKSVGEDGYVGVIYSDKQLTNGGAWNRVGGVDGAVRLSDGVVASAALLGSGTTFSDGELRTGMAGNANLMYESRDHDAGIWGGVQPADFQAENGFLIYSDWLGGGLWAAQKLYPRADFVPMIEVKPLNIDVFWRPSDGTLRDFYFTPEIDFRFKNNLRAEVGWWHTTTNLQGTTLDYEKFSASVNGAPTRWMRFEVEGQVGEDAFYETLVVGDFLGASVDGSVQVRRLRVGETVAYERLGQEDELYYAGFVSRTRVEVYATHELWARVLVDHDQFDKETNTSLLLAWQKGPGRAGFLGGSLGDPQAEELSWQAFAKASWVLQL